MQLKSPLASLMCCLTEQCQLYHGWLLADPHACMTDAVSPRQKCKLGCADPCLRRSGHNDRGGPHRAALVLQH